ncbi:hypothetical protein JCM17823_12580 [Halorubrum gandharaense]
MGAVTPRCVYRHHDPTTDMSGFPVGQLLYGLAFALFAVAFWSVGFVIANHYWKKWRGENGPRSDG